MPGIGGWMVSFELEVDRLWMISRLTEECLVSPCSIWPAEFIDDIADLHDNQKLKHKHFDNRHDVRHPESANDVLRDSILSRLQNSQQQVGGVQPIHRHMVVRGRKPPGTPPPEKESAGSTCPSGPRLALHHVRVLCNLQRICRI
jgi:hypothetical protein